MARATQFEKELDLLFERRTHWLRHILAKPKPGRAPVLDRRKREKAIDRLQELALEALRVKLARKYFKTSVLRKRSWRVKGHGYQEKRRSFDDWFERKVAEDNCVYVFWKDRGRCVYVGRTKSGGGRPSQHVEKVWFAPVRRVDVYVARGRSALPATECLAQHRFQPSRNLVKAAKRKWTAKCPLCSIQRDIKAEVRAIFSLR